jgi:hypothetical protein
MTYCSSKIVVFDLDETLGYFVELGMFWDALKAYIKYKELKQSIDQDLFNNILDLYPEFLRPNIIEILNYLKKKKTKRHCDKLMIYTNNQGPLEWANHIIKYFEKKLNYKLFDQIIAAFKVQGKRVELCRTTHMKTHSDLIICTKIPDDTQVCFIDDMYHPDMSNENIHYINVKPYIHDLEFEEMVTRIINSKMLGNIEENNAICKAFLLQFMKKYKYTYVTKTNDSQNIDKIISKKILYHLHQFFNKKKIGSHTNKTKKHNIIKKIIKNKTIKKHSN